MTWCVAVYSVCIGLHWDLSVWDNHLLNDLFLSKKLHWLSCNVILGPYFVAVCCYFLGLSIVSFNFLVVLFLSSFTCVLTTVSSDSCPFRSIFCSRWRFIHRCHFQENPNYWIVFSMMLFLTTVDFRLIAKQFRQSCFRHFLVLSVEIW